MAFINFPLLAETRTALLFKTLAPSVSRLKLELWANRRLVVADAAATSGSVVLSVLVHRAGGTAVAAGQDLMTLAALAMPVGVAVYALSGFYRKRSVTTSAPDTLRLARGAGIAAVLLWLCAMLLPGLSQLPPSVHVMQALMAMPAMAALRLTARHREAVRRARRAQGRDGSYPRHGPRGDSRGPWRGPAEAGEPRSPVLLVGTGPNADLFVRSLRNPGAKHALMGIIDDISGTRGLYFHDVEILGSVLEPDRVIAGLRAANTLPRRVFLSEPLSHFDSAGIGKIVAWAEAHGIPVAQLPRISDTEPLGPAAAGQPRTVDPEDILDRPQKAVERSMLRSLIKGRRVLVTGAGGSIGSELTRQIASFDPSEFILVENSELNAYTIDMDLARHFPGVRRRIYVACIRDAARINDIFTRHQPELVFNAAALKHVPMVEANPCEGVLTNVIGTRNVADAARRVGAIAMVQISSDKAVNATSVMGATKRVAEFYVQAQDRITLETDERTRFFSVRFGNVLGSSGSLIPLFQTQIRHGGPLTVTDPRMTRYFMTIREAVQLSLVAAAKGLANRAGHGEIFVFDMGEPVKIIDLARRMIALAGLEPDRDIEIKVIGIRPGEKLFEELFDRAEERKDSGIPGVQSAVPAGVPMPRLRAAIWRIEAAARSGDEAAVKAALRDLVPGYLADRAGTGTASENAKETGRARLDRTLREGGARTGADRAVPALAGADADMEANLPAMQVAAQMAGRKAAPAASKVLAEAGRGGVRPS
ncbi:polysaccharide biosynthesis protein [Frigidibacter oleivorans]|uniref:polysaccharide biosynthesis protein n=1 Tax=Frigidibacter oleivorans TaxID=2487129 RepID=UPI000F8F2696|nr:nucleoside-diphosphate sugar epimerase/dehydratase [Frigidibacter oleivorans]